MNEITQELALESLPLGPEQRMLVRVNSGTRHVLVALTLDGDVQPQALRSALEALASRHATLAHAYTTVSGYVGLRAVPREPAPPTAWELHDLAGMDDAQAAFESLLARELAAPLALAEGQAWRTVLCRFDARRWRLLLSIAELAADRGSRAQIARELVQAWRGETILDSEDEGPLPYVQYVAWRHELEQDADAQAARAYWRDWQASADDAGPLRLPYRREFGEGAARADSRVAVQAPVAVSDAVLALARRLAPSGDAAEGQLPAVDVVLQAAWWALLARIAGQSRYVGGWLHDCRRDYDMLAGAVGRYEKVMPLALSVDLDESFETFTQALSVQLEAHREVQEYWPAVEPAVVPRAGFGLLPSLPEDTVGQAWRVEEYGGDAQAFELILLAGPAQAGVPLALELGYDPRCLDEQAAVRLLEQYQTLLRSLAEAGQSRLADVALVGPQEALALSVFNAAQAGPRAVPVPQQVQAWAHRAPDALALQWAGGRLDYAALQARVDGWAGRLVAQGVTRGDIVALDLPLGGELVVALLAVMRAGAAYLPLDPAWPAERRDLILANARPALRLVAPGANEPGSAVPITLAFDLSEQPFDTSPALPQLEPGDAAYVLYTSGSTGTPKGVVIEHAQLSNYVAAAGSALDLAQCRRFGLVSSVAADLGNTALFGALWHGAALVVASPDATRDPQAFARYVADHAIDCLKIVPSHLAALLDEPPQAQAIPATLVLGGEATPIALVRALRQAAPQCRIFNHYGPTETTVGVLVHEVPPGADPERGVQLPLSHVLDGNAALILNAAGGLAATGELGELAIGGAQVCRGYLGLTDAAKFCETSLAPGLRFYRTGDLARHLPLGGIVLAGRSDHQLKIRGHRVEPAEVEATLLVLPTVRQAAVRAWPDSAGAMRLVAYVAGPDDAQQAARELRAALQEALPAHMVPAAIVVLETLPRLPNGKLDLAALPDPDHLAAARSHAEPGGDIEWVLALLIAELLERERISVTDDLFEQGADSLVVIKLVARLRRSLQVEIQPGVVFDHPSVRALAKALEAQDTDPGRIARVAAARRRLDAMSPAERAALAERAREAASGQATTV